MLIAPTDLTPLLEKRLEEVLRSKEYRTLLQYVTSMCNTSPEDERHPLHNVADSVLRRFAYDLSSCSHDGNIIIMHLGVAAKPPQRG